MAIAHVANRGTANNATTATTIALSPTGTITAGNFLIVGTMQTADTLTSVSDTQGNTYQVDNTDGSNNRSVGIASSKIATTLTTGDTITATFSSTTTDRGIWLVEFSGLKETSWRDQNITPATGTGTAVSTGNITTTGENELIISVANTNSGGTAYTPGSTGIYNYTEVAELAPGRIGQMQWAIVGGAGTYTANATITSAQWTICSATYFEEPTFSPKVVFM